MQSHRVIPLLLLSEGNLYKTIKFSKPVYVGDPINAVKIFNEKEVDEICLLDISASKNKTRPNFELIKQIASEAFMPFSYGGGIGSLDDAKSLFRIGVEKIVINTSCLENLKVISSIVCEVGSQSVIGAVDVKRTLFGSYSVYSHVRRSLDKVSLRSHIDRLINSGIGELLINDVDNDGLMQGLDLKLINLISSWVNVPLVVCGGVGKLEHLKEGVEAGASAIAAGSMFIFHGKHKAILINYPERRILSEFVYDL